MPLAKELETWPKAYPIYFDATRRALRLQMLRTGKRFNLDYPLTDDESPMGDFRVLKALFKDQPGSLALNEDFALFQGPTFSQLSEQQRLILAMVDEGLAKDLTIR